MNLLLPVALLVLAVAVACGGGGDEPEPTPEATSGAATPAPARSPAVDGGAAITIDILNLRRGDCFRGPADTQAVSEIEVVPCSGNWEFRVLNTFEVGASGDYPDQDYFDAQANVFCPQGTDVSLAPGESTWTQGDRTVLCIQER